MRRTVQVLLTVLLWAAPVFAQCGQVVDQAGVLKGQVDVRALEAQGADVHVLTTLATSNLDITERNVEAECADWQNGAHTGRKSTLVVLAVSPASHKLGIYYGAAWHGALDAHWNRIKQDYMVPYFKNGDFTGGFNAASAQLAARLVASKDEALHPAVSSTVNQAADYSGLWKVFGWGLFLLACVLVARLVYLLVAKYRLRKELVSQAQSRAIAQRNRASDLVNQYHDSGSKDARLDRAAEYFARVSGAFKTDPDTEGLTVGEYNNLYTIYYAICRSFDGDVAAEKEPIAPEVRQQTTEPKQYQQSSKHHHHESSRAARASNAPSGGDTSIFAPIIVNTTEEQPDHEYAPVVTSAPEPEYGGGSSSYESTSEVRSNDDDSSSGGSSSWGSDSGSSSSFDSGGSSSFDSGSSGGGFDGGGGGSSDF